MKITRKRTVRTKLPREQRELYHALALLAESLTAWMDENKPESQRDLDARIQARILPHVKTVGGSLLHRDPCMDRVDNS